MRRYRLKRLRLACPSSFERGDEGRGFEALSPRPNPVSRREGVWSYRLGAQFVAVLLCGIALKYFYSTASVNELRWILAPTTLLVELITGAKFQFESHAGYMNSDHTFLIAASCAGVNFLLTAFLMLALGQLWRNRSQKIRWAFVPVAALIAYAATLVANTVRISTALRLHRLPPEISWLTPEQLHRFEGIFIYFGFLLLLFVASEWFGSRTSHDREQPARSSTSSFGLLWRVLFPLVIYYATTLGIPLVNGAYRQGADFWEHSLFVVLTPLIVVLPLVTFRLAKSGLSRAMDISPSRFESAFIYLTMRRRSAAEQRQS